MNRITTAAAVGLLAMTGTLTACTTPAPEPHASPAVDQEADIADTFDIGGGRMMYLECAGTGTPVVVIIGGQRASAEDWMGTDGNDSPSAFTLISEQTRVCAYDRPGTPVGDGPSRSDPVEQPANAGDMAADLRALLTAADIPEPIVIAAHSAGGLAARLYAATYPDAVAGMVLVDTLSEAMREHETAEEWVIQKPLLRGDIDDSIAEYPPLEWLDADTSFDQVMAAPPLRQMPLIVVSADEPVGPAIPGLKEAGVIGKEIPDDFGYVTDRVHTISQAEQAALVTGSRHILKTDSGHNVHRIRPYVVAGAVIEVVALVRSGADRVE